VGLLQHTAPLDRHGLAACKRHGHVRNKAPNVARELPIAGIASCQLLRMAEIGAPDGPLPGLDVPAPITLLRRFRSPSLPFHVTAFGLAHAGVLAALFAAVDRRARGLPHDAWRRSLVKSELIKPTHLTRKAVVYIRQSTPHQVVSNQEASGANTRFASALGNSDGMKPTSTIT